MSEDDALPTKLKAGSAFGPVVVDRAINKQLQALIPSEANRAVLSIKLKSADEERYLQGVFATRIGKDWGIALGGGVDLRDTRDYEVEALVMGSWK